MKTTKTGEWLKNERLKAGYSQGKLGKRVGHGNPQFISNIERGKCDCPIPLAKKICKILKIQPNTAKEVLFMDVISNFNDEW